MKRSLLRTFRTALAVALFSTAPLLPLTVVVAQSFEAKPEGPAFDRYAPLRAPRPSELVLRRGDRLAICGDSITEQRMYSRILETYLTACLPEFGVTVRQYGWSGEKAPGFLARMTNDCLRFKPTIATTCYGMNDHEYRAYEERIGKTYRDSSLAIVRAFKASGARVIHGSPGSVGKKPHWSKAENLTVDDMNENLCKLRNIGVEIASLERVGFADVFWPMLTLGHRARQAFGDDYAMAGKDGVHPDWAGQVVMATAFLKAMGLDGDLGSVEVDLGARRAEGKRGHEVKGFEQGAVKILSHRYAFCATGPKDKDNSMQSGMALSGFHEALNRFTLKVRGGQAARYKITWGPETRTYSAADLAEGVNLAAEFQVNPFSEAFARVDVSVAAKQEYETRQVKQLFHGPEGRAAMAETVALTEKIRKPLAEKVRKSFAPVEHIVLIQPE